MDEVHQVYFFAGRGIAHRGEGRGQVRLPVGTIQQAGGEVGLLGDRVDDVPFCVDEEDVVVAEAVHECAEDWMVSAMDRAVEAAIVNGVEEVLVPCRVGVGGDESVLQQEVSIVLGQDGL